MNKCLIADLNSMFRVWSIMSLDRSDLNSWNFSTDLATSLEFLEKSVFQVLRASIFEECLEKAIKAAITVSLCGMIEFIIARLPCWRRSNSLEVA